MTTQRKIDPLTFWRVANNTLGRMACAYGDPTRDDHDHDGLCLRDDEALAADLMLDLIAEAYTGDEDGTLNALTHMLDSIDRKE